MIRPAETQDFSRMLELTRAAGVFSEEEIGWATELVLGLIVPPPGRDYQLRVLAEGSEIAGYVCFGPAGPGWEVFDLYWLVVDRNAQGQGCGSRLLRFVEEEVRSRGGRTLLIETSASNTPARAFYERRGYREVSHLKDFLRRRTDRLVYAREI